MALVALHRTELDPGIVDQTLGCIFKYGGDIEQFRQKKLADLLQPGVDRVCASIPPDNVPARRVAEKVGMRIAGTVWEEDIDDVLLYEKRREDSMPGRR
jgi:hypothetical protein